MNSDLKQKNIFYISIIFILLISNSFAQISINEFQNNSGYQGKWNISKDIPSFIASYFREKYDLMVFSPSLIEKISNDSSVLFSDKNDLLKKLNVKYVINGEIITFTINRFVADLTRVAGYDTYTTEIKILFSVTDISNNKIVFQETFQNSLTDNGMGIKVFNSETSRKKEFDALENMPFNSPEFLETFVAKNLMEIIHKLNKPIDKLLKSITRETIKPDSIITGIINSEKNPFTKKIIRGNIISIDYETNEVFINMGSKDFIIPGEIINVYSPRDSVFDNNTKEFIGITDRKVGEVEIIEVRGEKFSLGIINKGSEKLTKGMELRKIIILPR